MIFYYLKFNNLSNNCEKYVSLRFRTHWKFCVYGRAFNIRKGPEYSCQLFNVLLQQTTYELKALQVYKFPFNNNFMKKR